MRSILSKRRKNEITRLSSRTTSVSRIRGWGLGWACEQLLAGASHKVGADSSLAVKSEGLGPALEEVRSEPVPSIVDCTDLRCPFRKFYFNTKHEAKPNNAFLDSTHLISPGQVANVTTYTYNSISPWQTRLIRLIRPSKVERILTIELIPVDFVDMDGAGITVTSLIVRYTAPSYVWGESSGSRSLSVTASILPSSNNSAKLSTTLPQTHSRSTSG